MEASKVFTGDVIKTIVSDVADTLIVHGRTAEVLWVGRVDDGGIVDRVSAAARGTADMVPALFPHMVRGDVVIHNHPGGDLRPSGPDLSIAARLGNQGIGFLIVNNEVTEVNVVAAPLPRRTVKPLDVDVLTSILEPDGSLSRQLNGYETRLEQIDLLRIVAKSFNDEVPVIAEAGTGVGKSLAYLLPALVWASTNSERVVISTATIALQQQLMDKDIPLVCRVLGIEPGVALVKGRNNYLCLKRLQESGTADELFGGDGLQGIRSWANATLDGSRSDIPFKPDEQEWARVRCEADNCPGSFCSFFERCFLMKARRRAAESTILVANHHLLFSDLAARLDGAGPDEAVVLPPYRRIILDEAHHVEASATDLFTASLSLPGLIRIFNRMYLHKGKTGVGLLTRMADFRPDLNGILTGEIPGLIDSVRGRAETLDVMGRGLLNEENRIRLPPDVTPELATKMLTPMTELRTALTELTGRFAEVVRDFDDEESNLDREALAVEARQTVGGLQELVSVAETFLNRDEHPDQVFWLESIRRADGTDRLAWNRTPISVAPLMRDSVWEPFRTVICVSATLSVGGVFDHWKTRVGADRIPVEPIEALFSSPFDYRSRVLLGVTADAPTPDNTVEWEAFLTEAVSSVIDLSGGHALVLFTSYESLRRTLAGVRSRLGPAGPLLLAQGDDDRGRLLRTFRDDISSVLFATDSFWEGVDVPGDALRLVLITRLPFRPPTDPVDQARRDAIAAAGGNPFIQLSLPDAVIRFRQGFGRLMRHSDDRGAVVVLDSRICNRRYGPLFLEALPSTIRSIKPLEGFMRDLENFLFPQE